MQEILRASIFSGSAARGREKVRSFILTAAVTGAALVVFGCIFNRATVLSYSIGYNLYGSERVLAGEIPYRDFHTLYPPATLYINAMLFKWMGISLYNAMLGVFVFKVLTIVMLYLSGQQIVPRSWAFAAACLLLFWLRPNGAFKAVPMQYGALFLAIGLFLLLKHESRPKIIYLFWAGVALGALTLFKHNIGAYALAGYLFFAALERGILRRIEASDDKGFRRAAILASGIAIVIIPTILYALAQGALASMARTLLLGPGEFLATRMVFPRSPVVPALFFLGLSVFGYAAYKFKARHLASIFVWALLVMSISIFALLADEPAINKLIFYGPLMIFAVALPGFTFNKSIAAQKRRVLFRKRPMRSSTTFRSACLLKRTYSRNQTAGRPICFWPIARTHRARNSGAASA